jgi:hypothetical protein
MVCAGQCREVRRMRQPDRALSIVMIEDDEGHARLI